MCKKEHKNSEENQNKAQEPAIAFQKVQFFDSFEEQEQAELKWLVSQTPEQHLEHTVSLIQPVFADELKQHPKIGNQLHIN